jgi:ADP-heptose:LPS heptosyltransferase
MTDDALVVRFDSMGDVLMTGPAVRAVAHGPRTVTMLCGPRGEEAARLLPGVERVIVWDCPWIANPAPAATTTSVAELLALLKDPPAEALILTSYHQSPLPTALLLRMAGVRHITAISEDYPGSLLDVRLRPGTDVKDPLPEPERGLAVARAAGFELAADDDGSLAVRLPEPWVLPSQLAAIWHSGPTPPYIVVHPGADAPARTWPVGHYAECVGLLVAEGLEVMVTGGPGDVALCSRIAASGAHNLAGRTDVAGLGQLISGAALMITGNTGPAHLAAAVHTPVVCLFAPVTASEAWAPYGVPLELLGDQDAPCALTRARECPVPGHPCLSSITPEQVVAAVHRLASSTGATLGSYGVPRSGAGR